MKKFILTIMTLLTISASGHATTNSASVDEEVGTNSIEFGPGVAFISGIAGQGTLTGGAWDFSYCHYRESGFGFGMMASNSYAEYDAKESSESKKCNLGSTYVGALICYRKPVGNWLLSTRCGLGFGWTSFSENSQSDSGVGFTVGGQAYYRLSSHFSMGLNVYDLYQAIGESSSYGMDDISSSSNRITLGLGLQFNF